MKRGDVVLVRFPHPSGQRGSRYLLAAAMVAPAAVILFCICFPRVVGRPSYVAIYFAPAIGGFLLWIHFRLRQTQHYGFTQGFVDGLVILLCSLRMTAPLVPMSGHMLFFVYAGITIPSRIFRSIMAVLIIQTSIIKLLAWGDYWSWFLGSLSGVALGAMFVVARRHHSQLEEQRTAAA
jgi:hypothetical protein